MQPKLEMSLCHCGESVCVCYVSVLWLITRISPLYCSTDPLWSAPPTHTHRPTLSPFISLPLSFAFFPLSFAFVFLSFHIYISPVSVYHGHLSRPLILICLCCRYACLRFAFIFRPQHWNICVYTKLCACVYPWVAFWMFVTVWGCERVRTRAIREQYMMYSLKVLNILMHMAANLRKHPAIYNSHTHTHTDTQPLQEAGSILTSV